MELLIVDNNDRYCHDLLKSLEDQGCTLRVAHDPAEALAAVAQFYPEKVVLEQNLGEKNGLDLIEPILNVNSHTKIVVMSRSVSLAYAVKAIKLGAFNYLPKPVDALTLIDSFNSSAGLIESERTKLLKPMSIKRFEWEYIHTVLANRGGNISAAARELGINRRTLQRKLKKYPSAS